MKKILAYLFAVTLSLNFVFVQAQKGDTLIIQRNEKGRISFAKFKQNSNSNRKMQNDTSFLKLILHAKKEDEFKIIKENVDELGIVHKRFQQYYKGIKVENVEYLIHGKNGHIETINGDYQEINVKSIVPLIDEKQALINQ